MIIVNKFYIPVIVKFWIAFLLASLWFVFCFWFSLPWIHDLAVYTGTVLSLFIIFFIALIPGFMQMFLFVAYLFDKRQKNKAIQIYPPLSIIMACFNESAIIAQTLQAISMAAQQYPSELEIIVVDDGSTDNTVNIINELAIKNVKLIKNTHFGKANCLNLALLHLKNDLVVSLDADTLLTKAALTKIVERLYSSPSDTAAVAGTVFVKNSRQSFITRLQEWDYFLAITAIKRMQSLLQGTLVAQGAFSLFKKSILLEIKGWPNLVGEDIVMSWSILKKGYRIGFAEQAIAFTCVPETYKGFFLQRARWARGMLEAFRAHPGILITPRLSLFLVYWNALFPVMDFVYLFVFFPGVVLALLGYFFIAGPMTLALLPLVAVYTVVFFLTHKKLFNAQGFKVRKNKMGFIFYVLFYQIISVPAHLHGYFSELLNMKKNWGRKK